MTSSSQHLGKAPHNSEIPSYAGYGSDAGKTAPAYTLSQFSVQGELGKGSFGVVQRVVNQDSGKIYAMKILEKTRVVERGLQEQLKREVLTQLRVKHPNLVTLHYYFEDSGKIYCLLEFADKGQLFAYLKSTGKVPEPQASAFFADTAAGVAYLHGLSVVHRDLKPENILLFGAELKAKLCDFGWCVELTASEPSRLTFCGTLDYVAPEMLMGQPHDYGVDLWALGVLLFEMLLGRAPFASRSKKESMDLICSASYILPTESMSPGPQELVRGLLVKEQTQRMPLRHVLASTWVIGNTRHSSAAALVNGHGHSGGSQSNSAFVAGSHDPQLVVSSVPRPKMRSRRSQASSS